MPIRAAFDIGSSHHKLTVAHVSPSRPPRVIFSTSVRIPLADSLADDVLPPDVLDASHDALAYLKALAHAHGATTYSAIATQVFRAASNGCDHLSAIRKHGLDARILTPFDEGVLGFSSALLAAPDVNVGEVVVWDSGGGSTQWTIFDVVKRVHRVHCVAVGSGQARRVIRNGVESVRQWVREEVIPESSVEKRISSGSTVLGIGSPTSMFGLVKERIGRDVFGKKDVLRAMEGETESEVIAKLVVLAEMMAIYGVRQVRHVRVNGSCLGLLATDRFWEEQVDRPEEERFRVERSATTPC